MSEQDGSNGGGFSRETIRNTRMLHLVKKVNLTEKTNCNASRSREEKEFLAWGYYSYMTYTRFCKREVSFEHCFEIRYPYTRSNVKLLSDQYFTLLDRENEIDPRNDPFEYTSDKSRCIPFLGIYLISIEGVDGDKGFKEILDEYVKNVENVCKDLVEKGYDHIWKIFYTLNCVDICLAVRTDKLELFPKLRIALKKCGRDISDMVEVVITPILFCEKMQQGCEQRFYNVFQKNRSMRLNIRVGISNTHVFEGGLENDKRSLVEKKISCENLEDYVFDIIGTGDYAVVLTMDMYFHIFAALCQYEKEDFNSETGFFENVQGVKTGKNTRSAVKTLVRWILDGRNITFHERFRFPKKELCPIGAGGEDNSELEYQFKIAEHYIKKLDERRKALTMERYGRVENSCQYVKYISLVKDLIYTYNDLWYQSKFSIRGYIFYAQMAVMMKGIESYLSVVSGDEKGYTQKQREGLMMDLLLNMHESIICINNYNKLLQNLQQSEVNHPSYEIQTKVNAEKYFLAYTDFLMEICEQYFLDKEASEGVIRFYPIVTLDVRKSTVMTQMLFGKEYGEIGKSVAFYSVIFPDYRRFSNIFHVLPLLIHEISHYLRFQERKKRNQFVVDYVLGAVSERIIENMTMDGKSGQKRFYLKKVVKILSADMSQYLGDSFKEKYKDVWEGLHLSELTYELEDFLEKIYYSVKESSIGYRKAGKDEKVLWEMVQKELDHLDIDVLDLPQLKEGFLRSKNIKEKSAQEYRDLAIKLYIEYFGSRAKGQGGEKEDRTRFYGEIKECLETYGNKDKTFDLNRAVTVLLDALDGISSEKVLREFLKVVWLKEAEMLINEWGGAWKDADLPEDEKLFEKFRKIVRETVGTFRRTEKEFHEAMERSQEILSQDIFPKIERQRQRKFKAVAEELMIEAVDRKMRFQNFSALLHSASDDGEDHDRMIDDIHEKLYHTVRKIYEDKGVDHLYLASEYGSQILVDMGLSSQDPRYFRDKFLDIMKCGGMQWLKDSIRDRVDLYSEIYADLGMCATFSFTAFGYLRFAIHISEEEWREHIELGWNLEDARLLRVVTILLMEEEDAEKASETGFSILEKRKDLYLKEIVDKFNSWLKENGIEEKVEDCDDVTAGEDRFYKKLEEEHKNDGDSDWKNAFHYYLRHAAVGTKIRNFTKKAALESAMLWGDGYIQGFYDVYINKVQTQTWIQKLGSSEIIGAIGKNYNDPHIRSFKNIDGQYEEEDNVLTSEERMALQVDFIQKKYQEYKDRFMRLSNENLSRARKNKDYLEEDLWPDFLVYRERMGR